MSIYSILQKKIFQIITSDLTIGRQENNLIPYSYIQITEFIYSNINTINVVIKTMIYEYDDDDDLELLYNPENDWVSEYLYDFLQIPINFDTI
jgi:hypothetical protein